METWLVFIIALTVGVVGSMLGIGGGVFIIPILTLFFGVPIKTAIATSIVSVVVTSTAAGAVYTGRGMAHVRLGMVLEIATTLGALIGGLTAILLSPRVLEGLFALLLMYMVVSMERMPKEDSGSLTGLLDTHYYDPIADREVAYGVRNLPAGLLASLVAGNVSGLLGVGGGIIKVPIMVLVMGVPLKAAIATSNFMIGVTAATSAIIYYTRGYIDLSLAVVMSLGILLGARLGPTLGQRARTHTLKRLFQGLLIVFALQMIWKVIGG